MLCTMLMANRSDRRFRTLLTNHDPRGRLNDQQNEARGNPSWPGLSFTPTQEAGYTTFMIQRDMLAHYVNVTPEALERIVVENGPCSGEIDQVADDLARAARDIGSSAWRAKSFFIIGAERLPFRELGAAIFGLSIRPGRKLCVRRDHAEPLLIGKNLLAEFVPAHVELALELPDPLWGGLVRSV